MVFYEGDTVRKIVDKTQGLIRGTSSAVILSLAIHGALILGAISFVAYKYVEKKAAAFVPPPPVERPKMDLKKPKVKVRKDNTPRSAKRISVNSPLSTPELALPELSGMGGGGLGGSIQGFELVPDVAQMSLMGSSTSIETGNDFEGTYYSLFYDRGLNEIGTSRSEFVETARKFHESGWNPRVLSQFYRAPHKLYTTHFCIPPIVLARLPSYFGIKDRQMKPVAMLIHYKGKMMSKKGGRYRFWGVGDACMTVRWDEKIVFEDTWDDTDEYAVSGWKSSAEENLEHGLVRFYSTVGDWFEMEPGKVYDMEVLFTKYEGRGGWVLCIEDESVDYEETKDGGPCLPPFKTAPFAESVRETIEYSVNRDVMDLDGGELFNVY